MSVVRKSVHLKGSTLVFSLIVLAFLLVSAISLATVAVTEKRAALSTAKSNLSFQAADSGAEAVLVGIKEGDADNAVTPLSKISIDDFFGGDCSGGMITGGTAQSGTYEVTFYKDDTSDALGCDEKREDVIRIISKGFYVNTTRAIEVGIPPAPLPAP